MKGAAVVCLLLSCLALAGGARRAAACASCSTTGDDPLVLYPHETWKIYLGASRRLQFDYVTAAGRPGFARTPDTQDSITLAAARAVGSRGFVTVAWPALLNRRAHETAWGTGDLTVGGRATLLQQDFSLPWLPQIQVLAAYRSAIARAETATSRADLLDVFGAGFDEMRLGADVWCGMFAWQFGAMVMGIAPLARRLPGDPALLRPGPALRVVGTVAYNVESWGRIIVAATYQVQGDLQRDAKPQQGSDQRSVSVAGSAEIPLGTAHMLRLGVTRLLAAWSRNSLASTGVGVSYTHAW